MANKLARPVHEMSVVWKYFQVSPTNSKFTVCNDCKALVMRGGNKASSFNTSNLITYLKTIYAELHATFVYQSDEKKLQPTPEKNTQLSLERKVRGTPQAESHLSENHGVYRTG